MSRSNLAARAGAWSTARRRRVIACWMLFVVLAAGVGGALGTKTDNNEGNGQSLRVGNFLERHFPQSSTETILIQARHGGLSADPAYPLAVHTLTRAVTAIPHVSQVVTPMTPGQHGSVSPDGRSALVSLQLADHGNVDRVLAATARAAREYPSLRIAEFGDASSAKALNATLGTDFHRAETLSIPITLLILLFAFGSLVAAGVPMLLGLTAVLATLGLVGGVSQLLPMDSSISSVVLLIGLAVGVDYSLFYLHRVREERAAGADRETALAAASATSGHAILVSGLTVIIAMAGMFFAGSRVFESFAVGTIIVVAVAVLGSLTVLPAVISSLGSKLERGRVPLLHRLRRGSSGSRLWGALIGQVVRRPRSAAALSAGLLVALAIPVLGMQIAIPGASSLPRTLPIMQTYARMQKAFPGGSEPAFVGIEAPEVRAADVQAGVRALIARAAGTPGLLLPVSTEVSHDGRAETVAIPLAGNGTDARSDAALGRLRRLVPETVGIVPGVQAGVTGETAGTADFDSTMDSHIVYVFAFVLGMAFLLLLATFRSLLIALQAIVLNLLSVGAAYGILVLVFQDGHGHSLLGFQGTGPIVAWLPLFLFVVLFGLSMDYHVFILSRVREAFGRGLDARAATVAGLRSTAGVVTSAALVMVAVFSVFATLSVPEFKQLGVGLAAAILLDATIVRCVLSPATLVLLGDRAWRRPARGRGAVSRNARPRPRAASYGRGVR